MEFIRIGFGLVDELECDIEIFRIMFLRESKMKFMKNFWKKYVGYVYNKGKKFVYRLIGV